jgi:hypothetical protein
MLEYGETDSNVDFSTWTPEARNRLTQFFRILLEWEAAHPRDKTLPAIATIPTLAPDSVAATNAREFARHSAYRTMPTKRQGGKQ